MRIKNFATRLNFESLPDFSSDGGGGCVPAGNCVTFVSLSAEPFGGRGRDGAPSGASFSATCAARESCAARFRSQSSGLTVMVFL
jgi:hypothetical protein